MLSGCSRNVQASSVNMDGIQKEPVGVPTVRRMSLRIKTGGKSRDQVKDRCSGNSLKTGTGCQGPLLK